MFLKEVQTLAKLHHRNIVQFYGACLEMGSMFFVTELMKVRRAGCQDGGGDACTRGGGLWGSGWWGCGVGWLVGWWRWGRAVGLVGWLVDVGPG